MKTTRGAKSALTAFLRQDSPTSQATKTAGAPGARTARLGMRIRPEVSQRMAQACLHTPGLTLVDLVEQAVMREVDRLERERGEPFPEVGDARPKSGRPLRR